MQTTSEVRAALKRVPLLARLSDGDCDSLLRFLRERRLVPGEALFRQGEPGDTLVVVVEGVLAVKARRSPNAPELELARVGPGEVVGESTCLDPAPRSATVEATTHATVFELSRDAMTAMRQYVPRVASSMIGVVIADVTRRLREVDARIERELAGPAAPTVAAAVATAPERANPAPSPSAAAVAFAEEGGSRSGFWNFIDRLRGAQ